MREFANLRHLSEKKRIFHPLEAGQIGIYVCGMTVYDHCHLGHGRVMVRLTRLCISQARGFDVTYVRNITDDDKIFERAAERKIPFTELTAEMIGFASG